MLQGRLNKSNGYFYEGGWSNGRKNGQGLAIYPNGDCYEGYWLNDLRDGEGKYWMKKYNGRDTLKPNENDERVITGIWKKDVMKSGVINEKRGDEDWPKKNTK